MLNANATAGTVLPEAPVAATDLIVEPEIMEAIGYLMLADTVSPILKLRLDGSMGDSFGVVE